MNKNKVYTHVSLFSGAGGLDIGLEQAGFRTVWANDFNHDACETHRLWSNATVVEGDIGKVDYDTIPDCGIASFGFPCQGFSLSGPRKINDSRNVLYRHCVKLVEKKQPKLFLAENVKGLLTLGGGKIKDAIIADFESKGYVVSINLVNAADYHVPEDRQRILLVGIRKDIAEKYGVEFKVPAPFPDRISIRQALEELAPAAEDEICKEAYSSRYMSRNRKRGWDSVSFTIPAMAKQVPLWPGSPAGRNRYANHQTYSTEDVEDFVNQSYALEKERETKEYQRKILTPSLRYDILKRDNFKCVICGRTPKRDGITLHVDHIIPVSKGGKTEPENLRTLCSICNLGKSDKYDENGLN